jgi:outer membrane protein OmpA-like peptidoglycan-associated protein
LLFFHDQPNQIMNNKRLSTLVLCLSSSVLSAFAQQEIKELPSGYYMTVAAYLSTGEGYAMRYVNKLQEQGFSADYGFTYKKNMYFVYVKHYSDFKVAVGEINSTRKIAPFDDAWVYVYKASNPENIAVTKEIEKTPEEASDKLIVTEEDSAAIELKVKTSLEEETTPAEEVDHSLIVYFEALRARTQEPVDVEITLLDPVSRRVITTMKSGETKKVQAPSNVENRMRVITNTFGWKKDAVSFNFADPVTDSTDYFLKVSNDTLILFFDMHRLRKGDVQILYDVYFKSEAAIMREDSKFQLGQLWGMLEENPETRIMLHGHTNGNASGSYTRLAKNDTIFFRMTSTNETTSGSAKKLSYDRAMVVKKYLVWKGIDADRLEVKGWGGKKQIYDENSRAAQRNIRVEVEILQN